MLRQTVILFAQVFAGSFIVIGFMFRHGLDSAEGLYKIGLSALSTAILWVSNANFNSILQDRFDWVRTPEKRFFFNLGMTAVVTFVIWWLISILWNAPWQGIDIGRVVRNFELRDFLPTLGITLFISVFMHGRSFLSEWRNAAAEAERLKKEQIAAQYETLKNQVNPHFLFNSLNVLTALVHRDADQAEQFVRQMSKVYRYVLDSRNSETVPLEQEAEQLEAYVFLLKIRFNESFSAKIDIKSLQSPVAPLSLQMLVENAVKHNEASKDNPLFVEVFEDNGYIVVRNNLQPKSIVSDSSGVGLSNIRARYAFLTDKPVEAGEVGAYYEVRVPLL